MALFKRKDDRRFLIEVVSRKVARAQAFAARPVVRAALSDELLEKGADGRLLCK